MQCRGIIVGAGILGSAVAYELSRRGLSDIHVIDPDLQGPLSSTERNAGGVRHLWHHSINIHLSRTSIQLFETIAEEIGFQQTGYLWLFNRDGAPTGQKILGHIKEQGLSYEEWSVSQIRSRYPFIDKTDDLAFGIFGKKDGIINSNALKNYYRKSAIDKGVKFHDRLLATDFLGRNGQCIVGIHHFSSESESESFLRSPSTRTPEEHWTCDWLVLACGPWMAPLLNALKMTPPTKPVRRQISVFSAEGFDMTPYGMVVDTSRVYFHPEGGNILAGMVLEDETEGFNFEYDHDFFETHIWPNLFERSTQLERLKLLNGWAGLYSYTPDTSGILGRLPGFQNIYEIHSFTGRGVMQSYGAAICLGDLVTQGKFIEMDGSVLARDRFKDPSTLLVEGLHI